VIFGPEVVFLAWMRESGIFGRDEESGIFGRDEREWYFWQG
jgi:hypothetical protein